MRVWAFVICVVLSGVAYGNELDQVLVRANADFTYHDSPIHPGLIKAFHNWESDYRPPITVSIDVGAAFDTNQYGADISVDEGGRISTILDDGGKFAYRHLGRVAGDIHVLHTIDKSPGTGVFQTISFVQFDIHDGYDRDGLKPSRGLLMSVVRVYPLGGLKAPSVELNSDGVVVVNGGHTVTLDFKKPPVALANPASVNCAQKGGRRESKTGEKGEYTMCHLPDGTICEEWALFRGTCP